MSSNSKPKSIYYLIILIAFQGLSGIAGGFGLMIDPSGESLSIPIEWLEGSFFDNYAIPGIILFFVLGIVPLVTFFGLLRERYWAWLTALIIGIALIIWIIVEILVIGYKTQPPLQLIYGITGILIIIISVLPGVKKYYKQ